MSLSITGQWTLKDKNGNPPPPNIVAFSQKIPKVLLFPCPRSADELEMPNKENCTPREMNSFIVFRRQLAHVAKNQKTSDDGRVISSAASYMWNGASADDKRSYAQIAVELKRRHRLKYPNYTYERRKKRGAADEAFIVYSGAMVQNKNKKKQKKSHPAPQVPVSEEPECIPISIPSLQEPGNEEWFNPFVSQVPQISQVDNNFCYNLDNECFNISDETLPLIYQSIMGLNYLNLSSQQLQTQNLLFQQSQQSQQSIQQISPTFDEFFLSGNTDMGINPTSCVELERPINDVIYNNYEE